MDEIARDDFVAGNAEDVLEVSLGRLLHGGSDFLERGRLGGPQGEIHDGDGRRGDAERHARKLAGDFWADQRHSLGGSGGGRDDVDGG